MRPSHRITIMIRKSALLAVWLGVGGCGDNGIKDLPPELAISRIAISVPEDGVTTVNATAVDADGDKLTYLPTAPSHGELTGTGPEFTYTPVKDYNGPDSLMVVISDGTKQVTAMIDITVTPIDDAPVAEDIHAATNEDQGVNVVLAATDIDNDTLTYSVVVGPAHGTLTGVAPNLTYTPNLHYFGPDTFTFRASDGSLASGVATATVVIDNVITCGDGVVEGNEQCDDGNTVQSDSCLNNCMLATCGDGQVELEVEQCDDGNGDNTDACLTTCESARCGDSFVWAGEEACDDGNDNDNDACLSSCVLARCGDGFVEAGVEQCDDGNVDDTDACPSTCVPASCGDGFVEAGVETCDDSNLDDTDACPTTCVAASCGDGFVEVGVETCDDGNTDDGDACPSSCVPAFCGDGFVETGVEQCDDGNQDDTDACRNDCTLPPCADNPKWQQVDRCSR
jgi:cysteine-rich repeat protein